jgi:hypothetical protein
MSLQEFLHANNRSLFDGHDEPGLVAVIEDDETVTVSGDEDAQDMIDTYLQAGATHAGASASCRVSWVSEGCDHWVTVTVSKRMARLACR